MIRVILSLPLLLASVQMEPILSSLENGDLARAEALLDQELQLQPANGNLYYLLGRLRLKQSRPEEAVAAFRKAIEVEPSLKGNYLALGSLLRKASRFSEARQILEDGLRILPSDADLFYELAQLSADMKRLDDAVMYLKAIPGDKAPKGYWETVGKVLVSGRDFEGAEAAYLKVLEQRPESVNTLRALSGIALKQDDPEKAWDYIARARRIAPSSPGVIYEFALVSMSNELAAEAVGAARLLLLLEPDNLDYAYLLARSLLANRDISDGLEAMETYLQSRPSDVEALRLYGIGLYDEDQFEEARGVFERLERMEAKVPHVLYYLGMIAFNLFEYERAESIFKGLTQENENDDLAYLGLGKLYVKQRRYQEALSSLQKSISIKENDQDAHFQLSRVYLQLGQRELAEKAIERYRELKEIERRRNDRSSGLPFAVRSNPPASDEPRP